MRSTRARVLFMAVSSTLAGMSSARGAAVDFSTFTATSGVQANTFAVPNWQVVSSYNNINVDPNRVVQETTNADTTLFLGPASLTTLNKVITGDIYFGNDDDYVGLAFGAPQDPFTNTSSDYLLLQWKGLGQSFDFNDVSGASPFHNTTVGGSAPAGVSLSRVTGVPTADEFWQRANLTMYDPQGKSAPDPATDPALGFDTGGLLELGRGAVSGGKSYDRTTRKTSFEITYTPTNINVKINGLEEFNINAPAGQLFPEGTLGLYEQSQADNTAYAYFDVRDIGAPAPSPSPNLSPQGQPFSAADLTVPQIHGTTTAANTASPWSVVAGRTTAAPGDTSVVSAPNVGDIDVAVGGNRLQKSTGVLMATVRENGPRQNNTTAGASAGVLYGGVEAPSPSGFNTSTGLATFPYASSTGEWNVDVAVAHFPYSNFLGGYVLYDGAHNAVLDASSNNSLYALNTVRLAMPSIVKYDPQNVGHQQFWGPTAGTPQQTVANLGIAGKNAATGAGILFTIGASNENNFTGAAVLPDGTWNVAVRDSFRPSYAGPDTFEEDDFAFVYLEPGQVAESAGARVTGFNQGAPQVAQSWGEYTIDHVSPGVYELVVDGGETYTINSVELVLGGDIVLGGPNATPPPQNNQTLTPTLSDTAFSVAFVPFNPGDPSAGMLLLTNNGTLAVRNAADTADITVPTNHFLSYEVGGIPTWKSASGGNWSDAANWRVGVPNGAGASVNLSHAITAPRTVTLDVPVTVANLFFNSPQKYTIAPGGGNGLSVGNWLGVYGGSHEIAAPLTFTAPAKLEVGAGAALKLSGRVRGKLSDLSIGTGGTLDVVDNNLVLTAGNVGTATTVSGNTRLYDGLQGMVQRAKNGDAWNGPGLTSSKVATEGGLTTIGIANGAQAKGGIGPTETAVWGGETITGSSILAMYTYAGDANLDGAITGDDYSAIDFGILFEGMDGYANGDFNYDGYVTGDDYSVIDLNILLQGPQIPTGGSAQALAAVTAVPEPSACGFALVGAAMALRRRRARASRAG